MVCGGRRGPRSHARWPMRASCSMKAMSTLNETPQKASRPFGPEPRRLHHGRGFRHPRHRKPSSTRSRAGAHIYAELAGYAANLRCLPHHFRPTRKGRALAESMTKALADANLQPSQVDYINAPRPLRRPITTSSKRLRDQEGLRRPRAQGEHQFHQVDDRPPARCGPAASRAVISIKAIETGIVPPTINYETPEPRLRSRLHAERETRGEDRHGVDGQSRLRAATTPRWFSGGPEPEKGLAGQIVATHRGGGSACCSPPPATANRRPTPIPPRAKRSGPRFSRTPRRYRIDPAFIYAPRRGRIELRWPGRKNGEGARPAAV